jgi:hypothetical protein
MCMHAVFWVLAAIWFRSFIRHHMAKQGYAVTVNKVANTDNFIVTTPFFRLINKFFWFMYYILIL